MDTTLRFRASACGKYLVTTIGQGRPHVLALAEAEIVAQEYERAAAKAETPAHRAYELAAANAIRLALQEAVAR